MASKKVKPEEKEYSQQEAPVPVVSESGTAYGKPQDPIAMRTIGLMGMEGKKGFSALRNENDFISLIRAGIPRQAMTHLMDMADISLTEMASIVHASDRTLRRYAPQDKLSQEQSERIVEVSRLYSRGEEVFGSLEDFKEWMGTALLPFGDKKPREFLDTSLGIGMIMNELGRIEHGIFA